MKSLFLFSIFLLCTFSLSAQKTEVLYLSGLDKDRTVQWDFYCTHGRNSGKWSRIAVPSNWELQGFGSYLYGKTNMEANEKGLYKYEFTVNKSWQKKNVYIVFEGSMTDTEVKINGKLAGPVHQGAFYRFKYDISDLLNYGVTNLLEVTVSKESSNESVNRAERLADYWVFGGIFRPVYLEAVPKEFIDHLAIDAKADGSFYMEVFTLGKGNDKIVKAQIQTLEGKPFGPAMVAKIEDVQGKAVIKGIAPDPVLWNPEFPNMYQVDVSLMDRKKTVHKVVQKFGFRTVEVRLSDGIYVNDRKVMFRGVCRHSFWPSSGRTSSKKLAIEDVNLMKDMNMNAVRMSHYPPDQYFLDVCDSLGMFVLDELGGWQKFYDTPTAKRLVKQMVERDVNHPSVILWDNGNEGGFNKDVRSDYALYDPQKRTVIEPFSVINGTNTKHYPKYNYVVNALTKGKEIFFPTEFLHGLFDGGLGAGLDDQWNLMLSNPLAAGAFLWVFADEGVERRDKNDSVDTSGNLAPDGILGPWHQKEGSFYTVKEIWSPVYFKETALNSDFNGKLQVTNRFLYSNLNLCKYSFELLRYSKIFPETEVERLNGIIQSPDIPAGESGELSLNLPPEWKHNDVLYVTATDQYGRHINTWSWNITKPEDFVKRLVETKNEDRVTSSETDSLLILESGKTVVTFSKKSGLIAGVKSNGKVIPISNGIRFAGISPVFKGMKHYSLENKYIVELLYDDSSHATWTMLPGGWLQLDYDYRPIGQSDFSGITFNWPENLVTGAKLLANGPFHVWKNRLKGTRFGLYDKPYNNTITGQTWDYPEFKGYYSNFYAVELQTRELPITIVTSASGLFLHLFTPEPAIYSKGLRDNTNPPFPSGNISFLHGISSIGTKFSTAEEEGPQGLKNIYDANSEPQKGRLYFRFGK